MVAVDTLDRLRQLFDDMEIGDQVVFRKTEGPNTISNSLTLALRLIDERIRAGILPGGSLLPLFTES